MKKTFSITLLAMLLAACQQEPAQPSPAASTPQPVAASTTLSASEPQQLNKILTESETNNILNYQEKWDVAAIGLALQKSDMAQMQGKEAEWNARLAQAKTDADIKAVLNEQLAAYRALNEALSGLEMKSESGKTVFAKMKSGTQGVQGVLEQLQKVDLMQPQGAVLANELTPKIKQHVQDIATGMSQWVDMMKANGFNINQQDEQAFQEKMKEIQEKLK